MTGPAAGMLAGAVPAGVVSNEMIAHQNWLPTLLAVAGKPDILEKLKMDYQTGDKHL